MLLVGHSMKQIPHAPPGQDEHIVLHDLLAILLEISNAEDSVQASADVKEIGSAARWSLFKSLNVISAIDFSTAVLSMLQTGPEKVTLSS